ncbi:aldo/keto reductase [Curtobacterium sp. SL109]|uniref:aldo/keto reductase n=1 Tax=Curtobacterium sp. SL109 TaxID=2994662 RepID=UPI002DD423B2|nr:aldo/keto reductase [Curtobacterium sp. SL109]
MQYTRLGTSGLTVSRIALGCMSFGDGSRGMSWALDADAAEPLFRQALDLGITFWDTANVYGLGSSERNRRRGHPEVHPPRIDRARNEAVQPYG